MNYQKLIKTEIKRLESLLLEEGKYGMDTTYGDTMHPCPSVLYGKKIAIQDQIDHLSRALKIKKLNKKNEN